MKKPSGVMLELRSTEMTKDTGYGAGMRLLVVYAISLSISLERRKQEAGENEEKKEEGLKDSRETYYRMRRPLAFAPGVSCLSIDTSIHDDDWVIIKMQECGLDRSSAPCSAYRT
jgi:hypothetical protein